MITGEEVERKRLSFEQAEGAEPLPSQLALKQLSKQLRASLWHVVYKSFEQSSVYPTTGGPCYFREPWSNILYAMHVFRDGGMADDFDNDFAGLVGKTRLIFEKGDYLAVFGWLQWVLQRRPPPMFSEQVDRVLTNARAAYRVVDRQIIMPITSETEQETVQRAFDDLRGAAFNGAKHHLTSAANELTAGRYADSIRESIHAVELVARVIEPSAELSKALSRLEFGGRISRSPKESVSVAVWVHERYAGN